MVPSRVVPLGKGSSVSILRLVSDVLLATTNTITIYINIVSYSYSYYCTGNVEPPRGTSWVIGGWGEGGGCKIMKHPSVLV